MRARAAALVLLLAGGCGAPDARLEVVARVGRPPSRAAEPPRPAVPRRFGTETRSGLRGGPDAAFELPVEPGDREILFSTAVRSNRVCARPVRFTIQSRRRGIWRPVFAQTTTPGPPAWRDHALALERGAERLRFETRTEWSEAAQARACRGRLTPWWGSLRVLGEPETATRRGVAGEAPSLVVLLSLDTLGAAHLSGFGGPSGVSPRLDALLSESFSFRRAYASYGHTLPSHASLFSGLVPLRHQSYPTRLLASFPSLVPEIARAGYLTAAFTEGAYVSAHFGFGQGFDRYDDGVRGADASKADAAVTFRRALDWLERFGPRTRAFLFVHTYEVHIPYTPRNRQDREVARRLSPGVERRFLPDSQNLWMLAHNRGERLLSEREIAHLRALHLGEIHGLDRVVGAFVDRLARMGLADETLLIVVGDHGDQFGEGGKLSHDESLHNTILHVPLAFRWPGRLPPGASRAPVGLVDVFPTLLELLGIAVPPGLDGRSLAPALLGADPAPRPAFAELRTARGECARLRLGHACRLDRLSVQTERWKLVTSELPPWEVLYDLEDDPLETRDVAAEHPDEVARLRARLDAYRSAAGAAPAPAAAPAELDDAMRQRLKALGYLD